MGGLGNCLGNTDAHAGVGAVGDAGLDVLGVEGQLLVEHGIIAALQCLPVSHSLVPLVTLGGEFLIFQVFEGHLVGSYESAARTHFDREVAERQSTFHRQVLHHVTAVLNEIACST